MFPNQYEKSSLGQGTRYPFRVEGFCANRAAGHFALACERTREYSR
jgi:hypothetical protein